MVRLPLSILPLWAEFPNVLSQFGRGIDKSVRSATKAFLNANFETFEGEVEDLGDGEQRTATTIFSDGSAMSTSVVHYDDGSIGVVHTIMASSKEALGALIDAASAGFTEVDSQSLAAGLSK